MIQPAPPPIDRGSAEADPRQYPDRPWVGVGVVVLAGPRVLLVRRRRPPRQGDWGLPGGALELGETLFGAAEREIAEECGLKVRPIEVLTAVDAVTRDPDQRISHHYAIIEILAEPLDPAAEPVAGDDAAEAAWVPLADVERRVVWQETREVIQLAVRRRQALRPHLSLPLPELNGLPELPRLPELPPLRRRRRDPLRLRDRLQVAPLMHGPLGRAIARPWLDQVSLQFLREWYFPASRAWAAAMQADGALDRFCAALAIAPQSVRSPPLLRRALVQVAQATRRHEQAFAAWRAAFFDAEDDAAALSALEEARVDSASALSMTRVWTALFARTHQVPACRFAVPTPEAVEAAHGPRLARPETAYALPAAPLPEPRLSRQVTSQLGRERWLVMPSPDPAAETPLWGHVFEPDGPEDMPTVIQLHGLALEADHLRMPFNEIETLCAEGCRVIALEGPWHGFRRRPGWYGGEPVPATAPLGALDYFRTHALELAPITRWARRLGSRRVAWFGTSLGAMTAQIAAAHAAGWPDECAADALLLAATSEGLAEIALNGAMAQAFGVDRALAAAGWTAERLAPLRLLTDPLTPPVMGAENVFMLLGEVDTVAPFAGALAVAERWRVPAEQIWRRPQGHFSVHAGLMVDDRPLRALARRLHAGTARP